MKTTLTILLLVTLLINTYGQYNINGNYTIDGSLGIGTPTPSHKIDLRGGTMQVVKLQCGGYTFLGRNNDAGNDSYFYHLISPSYHILGSSKNGTGTLRKLGFALGLSDSESDIKMTIDNNGNTGIGTNTVFTITHCFQQ
ncbi:hypothetical protein [Chryseolinea sp. H1M3-3]|uniref:hypothetical protein n=1 Tax=Chryseolinea sp. H1M3-3 TaxID=3034144 RepID=UPI0023EDDFF9|nr:hypothetical protein [Chryseolinea sp. H1M3-3]